MTPLDAFALPLEGVRLIEANAGTGKTYTITTLCLRLLLERRLDIAQILVVTYTNAATAELRRKVRARLHDALAALRGGPVDPADATLCELVRRRRAAPATLAEDCARLEAALYGFDEAAIFTIHGFCQRVLQEHAFESGVPFDVALLGDDRVLLGDAVHDFWSRELFDAPLALLDDLAGARVSPARLLQLARLAITHPDGRILPAASAPAGGDPRSQDAQPGLAPRRLALVRAVASVVPAALHRRKLAAQMHSFDDLLQRVDAALRGPDAAALAEALRRRYPAALIDEFQDTDPVQYRIFEAIHGRGGTLVLIGDPKQAIYGFRGADVFAYVHAKQRCGSAVHTLGVNRRSGPSLVQGVNAIFARAQAPFVLPGIPFFASAAAPDARDRLGGDLAGRAPLRVLFVPRTGADGAWMNKPHPGGWYYTAIAAETARLLEADNRIDDRRLAPGDVAVLCRTNEQTRGMQAALAALGIPSVLQGDASVFDSLEAEQVERVVRALGDPADPAAVTAALLTPLVGLTAAAALALRQDERQWEDWLARFAAWHDVWRQRGFTAAFRRLLDECQAPARLLAAPGGERALTNIFHLGELLQDASTQAPRGLLGLAEWLQRMRTDALSRIEAEAEAAQIRLESDACALTLVTIHKSKGLQYPVVICPFLFDGAVRHPSDTYPCFHDPADGAFTIHLDPSAADQALAARERLAEHLRLLYVALTRAEQLCVIAWGKFRNSDRSALGYLLHQPPDHAPLETLADVTAERIKALSDAEVRADLDRLPAAAPGAVEVLELPRAAGTLRPVLPDDGPPLRARTARRQVVQRWRIASFSALTAGERALPEPAAEGRDCDELADADAPPEPEDVGLAGVRVFPRGRRLGTLVHYLLETADFPTANRAALCEHAAAVLPAYGIEARWAEPLADAVCDVLDTPLCTDPALVLRRIERRHRLDEVEFVFPTALAPDASTRGACTPERLAGVFARYGRGWVAERYAPQLARLPFGALAGYVKGYIDLVFADYGRWYVVDYKTNDLGPRPGDYRPERLRAEMLRHHYVLQAHLYVVALHRHLQRRLPGYAYERDFGGVLYLFVRAMDRTPGAGVFFDRPPEALVAALSATLAHPDAERSA